MPQSTPDARSVLALGNLYNRDRLISERGTISQVGMDITDRSADVDTMPLGVLFIWVVFKTVFNLMDWRDFETRANFDSTSELMNEVSFNTVLLFGVDYAIVDYERATRIIVQHAARRESFGVSALAVHGLVLARTDKKVSSWVKRISMKVPDGQPVRWALNLLRGCSLSDRVYGPTLTLHVLETMNRLRLSVYIYGSTQKVAVGYGRFIRETYPHIHLVGVQPDRFRDATLDEDTQDIATINKSGAHVVLVGRGCPRQEKWVAEHMGKVKAAMLAVGAAFDYHAGFRQEPPMWIQRAGLQWLHRLFREPKRLWKRYFRTNLLFLWFCFKDLFLLER